MFVEGKGKIFCQKHTLNCAGKVMDLSTPKVMGILNLTPDSFFDGGQFNSEQLALKQVELMVKSGVDIVDIGGYSSRPGSDHIEEAVELERVIPCLKVIKREFSELPISIDTFRSAIAKEAVYEGASIVNDISGGDLDNKMYETIAKLKVPYILMHMRGTPQSMQKDTEYDNPIEELINYFRIKLEKLKALNVNDVILDPGFGFGKSLNVNYQILHKLKAFDLLSQPILVGLSRKSMISDLLGSNQEQTLKGTMALNLVALIGGASIIRVHDVKEGKEIIATYQRLAGLIG